MTCKHYLIHVMYMHKVYHVHNYIIIIHIWHPISKRMLHTKRCLSVTIAICLVLTCFQMRTKHQLLEYSLQSCVHKGNLFSYMHGTDSIIHNVFVVYLFGCQMCIIMIPLCRWYTLCMYITCIFCISLKYCTYI